MVEYADFYVLMATLAPLFLFAGIVVQGRWASRFRGANRRVMTISSVISVIATALQVVTSAVVLAGFRESRADDRLFQIGLLIVQASIVMSAVFWGAHDDAP